MLPTPYMGEGKSDGTNPQLYFSYPTAMPPNMVTPNFAAYSMQIPPAYEHPPPSMLNLGKHQEDIFPTTLSLPPITSSSVIPIQPPPPPPPPPHQEEDDEEPQSRQQHRRSIIPEDEEARRKYRERRDKNNLAAKKSRSNRREREKMMQRKVDELEKENEALRAQLAIYTQQIECVRKEYERQMSLSYSAQQQGMLLRDSTTNLVPTTQAPTIFYPSFPSQRVT
ncbi:unnamed protein product [Thelazia callipaeda]|uniref:BZIP domain-containing protein n=1 Tax=Thelazia callipaeda TaxID=103827 RepID=A0A0N5D1N7_THECL|nr:unnamed protein product [Thelazia callipaeda]